MALEVWFYHLQRQRLEEALPTLLERGHAQGWRAVVQTASEERAVFLDDYLWTYRDESFLPHACAREGSGEDQPIWLTAGADNPNGADIRFFVDGAEPIEVLQSDVSAPKRRAAIVFDGNDEDALRIARLQFKVLREAGFSLSYWRQNEQGRWEKIA
jgi:DNA polymerase-3 subunit chi